MHDRNVIDEPKVPRGIYPLVDKGKNIGFVKVDEKGEMEVEITDSEARKTMVTQKEIKVDCEMEVPEAPHYGLRVKKPMEALQRLVESESNAPQGFLPVPTIKIVDRMPKAPKKRKPW